MFFLLYLAVNSDSAAALTSLTVFVRGPENQSRSFKEPCGDLCVVVVLRSTHIHFKEKSSNLYVMLSGRNNKDEVALSSACAHQSISWLNWLLKTSFVCFLDFNTDIQSKGLWLCVCVWCVCVCVCVCLACWIMASSLCGVEGHLAKLKSGRCRRWEERGREGRLTTYWWNEKSLAPAW